MAPMIEISEETFSKLQLLATPFVDTPESVIRRAVDCLLESSSSKSGQGLANNQPVHAGHKQVYKVSAHGEHPANVIMVFQPTDLPDVTHTTFINGRVGSSAVEDWNQLCLAVHAEVYRRLGSVEALQRVTPANIKAGTHIDHGFKVGKGLPFSIQGAEAKKACSIAFRLAREYGIPVLAEFRWQNKDKAAFPGVVGRLEWKPTTSS